MYKPEYGDPTLAVRFPIWMHTGLKVAARREGTTVSEILRELAAGRLKEHGITAESCKPIQGQVKFDFEGE